MVGLEVATSSELIPVKSVEWIALVSIELNQGDGRTRDEGEIWDPDACCPMDEKNWRKRWQQGGVT